MSAAPGFFGKLPSEGDFVRRRIAGDVLAPFEAWLEAGLRASRAALGEAWLDAFLTAPVWRFVLSGGVCGPSPAAGLLMPSVDRIGRHYPLALVAPLPPGAAAAAALHLGWWEAAESALLAGLDPALGLDAFDAGLAALPPAEAGPAPGASLSVALPPARAAEALAALLDALAAPLGPYSLWWRDGEAPGWRLHAGLPVADDFARLLRPVP